MSHRVRTTVTALVALIGAACAGGADFGGPTTAREPDTSPASTSPPTTESRPTTTRAPDSTAPLSTEPTGTTTAPTTPGGSPLDRLQVVATGFTSERRNDRWLVTAAAELLNDSDEWTTRIGWEADLFAADGTLLDDSRGFLNALAPNGSTWLTPDFFLDEGGAEPARLEVRLVGAETGEVIPTESGTLDLSVAIVSTIGSKAYLDINQVMHVEGEVANASGGRLTAVFVDCGVYRGGELLGGASTVVGELPLEALAGFDAPMDVAVDPAPDDVRCAATPTNLSTFEPGVTTSGLDAVAGLTYNPAGLLDREHDTTVGITVTNPTDQAALGVRVEVDLLDAEGRFVHLTVLDGIYVLPGETFFGGSWPIPTREDPPPATARARVVVDRWADPTSAELVRGEPLDLTAFTYDVTDARYEIGFGSGDLAGTITSHYPQTVGGARIACTMLDGDVPVGGNDWTLDPLVPEVATEFDVITGFDGTPAHDRVECTAYFTVLVNFS